MSEKKTHNFKNHTAITKFHIRQRKEFREKLTKDELEEVSLYFDENNHFVNDNTPQTIPEKYKILIVDKFYCKWCNGYHAAKKGSYLCPKNPDYEKNITANKNKAKNLYHNHGRKTAIKHGNNIHHDEIVERTNILNERIKNNPEILKAGIERYKQTEGYKEKQSELLKYARKVQQEKRAIRKETEQLKNVYKPHDFFNTMNMVNQIKNSIDNFNSIDFNNRITYDEFSGRRYNDNGEFDPFG